MPQKTRIRIQHPDTQLCNVNKNKIKIVKPGIKSPYHGKTQSVHGLGSIQRNYRHFVLNINEQLAVGGA